ncbi:MAG: hypothetical protein IJT83_16480 [Victivallales bacterium]|nr:hypothetical protein [Victivallales bacterium]
MKNTPLIIPEKQVETPITLSLPKLTKLDKLAKTLISSGIGLAIAGIVSSVLSNDDEKNTKNDQTENEDDAQ